jgi:hypothetical protein
MDCWSTVLSATSVTTRAVAVVVEPTVNDGAKVTVMDTTVSGI